MNQQKQDHAEELKELLPAKEMLKEAEKNNVDCQAVIKMMLNREYNTNSDASRYMNGEFCLDDSLNLPKGAKLIRRKDKDSGYDIWYVELITYVGPKLERRTYCIGRFNVPGSIQCVASIQRVSYRTIR